MYRLLADECWRQAGMALKVDKTLAELLGEKALAYEEAGRCVTELLLSELDQLQIKIDARLKFREECN